MIDGAIERTQDAAGPGPRLVGRWGLLREIWDELPVLLVANLALAVGLVPALVLWSSGSTGPSLVTASIACCLFWTYIARRFDPPVMAKAGGGVRSSSLATWGRSALVGVLVGALATSAALAVRWAASGQITALAVAVVTCCEWTAVATWALSGLRLASHGDSIRGSFRAGAVALRRNPGRAALVAYECAVVILLVVMFGFGVIFVLPGPMAAVAVRQLAGREETVA